MKKLLNCFSQGRTWIISVPYIWLLLFFFIPFAIVLKISLSESAIAIPPYEDLISYADDVLNIKLNLGNFHFLLQDDLYFLAYLNSLKTAFFATVLCLLVGYPMAYFMARAEASVRNVLLMLVILPSWTSFLIRIYAWIGILKSNGLLNNFLMSIGLIHEPLEILNTNVAVYIGIVYAYLPFMILPLYANLLKMDLSLLEAASDLGCRPWKTFLKVTLPLSKAGIIAGSMLVFIPAVGEFVIPSLLGGANTLMIGKVLWQEFFNNRDWPVASAVAIVMLLLLLVPIALFNRYQAKEAANEAK
ncbi:spermidine/putrescine ABC transporter permease [Pokkaliibacter plantistimulans]|uniref:Spermidine/putrescine ABC transporter permease n=2 Tax=Pseudomonadota TaxID=1224 RepID=A0ABX5LSA2_9GAMM|nr:ABC transporter permease subunit [Pokkaliibacter plantistimulans]PPC77482.1 putrescine ABC transporter permease PotH [Pokkaliibacter plantistimulans]PXF29236.1 spermidine/putrescine ABC transporter permease [Pokkaliibacter plantistimulans]